MTDPIADLLTRIRNGQMVGSSSIEVPYSKSKERVLNVLKDNGFVGKFKVFKNSGTSFKMLNVELIYVDGKPQITKIERVSKPGLRVYKGYKEFSEVLGGFGTAVVSTPQGVMSIEEAKKKKVGGEIICKVW